MLAIIELSGAPGAGKTTLAITLGEELAAGGILFIDASPSQRLTQMLSPENPELTLGHLFNRTPATTGSRESVDWVFHDMVIPVGEENDLITVGALPDDLGITEGEKLRYGLTRLIENYDYVVVDGYHPLIHRRLPEETLRTLIVLTPADLPGWSLPQTDDLEHTPAVILNRYTGEPFPPALEEALLYNQVQLIGKLPRYATPEDCIRRLSADFRNCLLRLNIPLQLSPHE